GDEQEVLVVLVGAGWEVDALAVAGESHEARHILTAARGHPQGVAESRDVLGGKRGHRKGGGEQRDQATGHRTVLQGGVPFPTPEVGRSSAGGMRRLGIEPRNSELTDALTPWRRRHL